MSNRPTQTLHYPSFRRWVGQQSGKYSTASDSRCPMALWAQEVRGFANATAGFSVVFQEGPNGQRAQIVTSDDGARFFGCIANGPQTYEELTRRLDAAFTKTGLRRRQKPRPPYDGSGFGTKSFKRGALG